MSESTFIRHRIASLRSLAWIAAPALLLLTVAACSDSDSPTEPRNDGTMVLAGAAVMVDGRTVNDSTVVRGAGERTQLRARLHDWQRRPVPGSVIYGRYHGPRQGAMHQYHFRLYDDGTHCDLVPGDGEFCYEVIDEGFGCHGWGPAPGEHHYEFWGEHPHGWRTGSQYVTVTVG